MLRRSPLIAFGQAAGGMIRAIDASPPQESGLFGLDRVGDHPPNDRPGRNIEPADEHDGHPLEFSDGPEILKVGLLAAPEIWREKSPRVASSESIESRFCSPFGCFLFGRLHSRRSNEFERHFAHQRDKLNAVRGDDRAIVAVRSQRPPFVFRENLPERLSDLHVEFLTTDFLLGRAFEGDEVIVGDASGLPSRPGQSGRLRAGRL